MKSTKMNIEITSDLWSEKQKVESVANAAKGRSDRKEVDRGGSSSENRQGVACADRDHSQGLVLIELRGMG
jgi:hypothetical protein